MAEYSPQAMRAQLEAVLRLFDCGDLILFGEHGEELARLPLPPTVAAVGVLQPVCPGYVLRAGRLARFRLQDYLGGVQVEGTVGVGADADLLVDAVEVESGQELRLESLALQQA